MSASRSRSLFKKYISEADLDADDVKSFNKKQETLMEATIRRADVLVLTLSTADDIRDIARPTVFIIDEAGQATEPDTLNGPANFP